jgi:hypothetical protein
MRLLSLHRTLSSTATQHSPKPELPFLSSLPDPPPPLQIIRTKQQLTNAAIELNNCISGAGYWTSVQEGRILLLTIESPPIAIAQFSLQRNTYSYTDIRHSSNARPSHSTVHIFNSYLPSLTTWRSSPIHDSTRCAICFGFNEIHRMYGNAVGPVCFSCKVKSIK